MMWDGQEIDPEQHMVIVRSREAWIRQVKAAFAELEASCGGDVPQKFADAQPANPAAFSAFVEAYYALFPDKVTPEIIALAGLVPVDQAISEG
jgi:hypothetical protein